MAFAIEGRFRALPVNSLCKIHGEPRSNSDIALGRGAVGMKEYSTHSNLRNAKNARGPSFTL